MNYWLYLIPVISAFTGWFTIWLATCLLFHPSKPKKILGFIYQGILPSRQKQFAQNIAQLICREIPSLDEITKKIADPTNVEQLLPFIDAHIDQFLRVKLKERMPVVGMFIGEKTINQMKEVFLEELTQLFPGLIEQYAGNLLEQLDLEKMVEEKVRFITREKMEGPLEQSVLKEIPLVQLFGAIIGFVAGLIQLAIILMTS